MSSNFERLEQDKRKILVDLSQWPAGRLEYRPAPGSWSALEVLDHLVKVEDAFVQTVRENLGSSRRVSVRDRMRLLMVGLVMRSPIRVRTPTSRVLPSGSSTLPETAEAWGAIRRQLAALLAELKPAQYETAVFRHPVSGWMTAKMGVGFLHVHLRHHRFQLSRLGKT